MHRLHQIDNISPTIGERLESMTGKLPKDKITLVELRDLFGPDGLLLLVIFIALPFMVPTFIPGVSTIFGIGILLIGISRLFGRSLWLPKRYHSHTLPTAKLRTALALGLKVIHRLEKIARPHRLSWMVDHYPASAINNSSLIIGSILLMAPVGVVPFTNTLPALSCLLFAIGFLQRDGVCIMLGHLFNLITVIYFTAIIAGGTALVMGTWHKITGL